MLFSLFCVLGLSVTGINASCRVVDGVPTLLPQVSDDSDATVYWEDSLNETGFYRIHVKGNKQSDSSNVMLCAGFLEGYVSHDRMLQHFNLIFDIQGWDRTRVYPKDIRDFLEGNYNYTVQSIEAYPDITYWQEIGLIMKQFQGMFTGYALKDSENGEETMDTFDLWFLQSEGDMFDISEKFPSAVQPPEKVGPGSHCTGMIRLLPDYSDIFFSHDAWSDYRELHGELKEYDLPIKGFKAQRVVMSTRIGKLSSYDDFYVNDAGLFVLETTMSNFNEELYDEVIPQRLFTWIRAIHATWTSESGKEWTDTFIKHNSGTYNNQYLVIDSKKFKRGEKPTKDLLWIVEQMPTAFRSGDITDNLVNDGYFPSINTPYFEDLFILAHFPQKIASWGADGNYWDYKTSSRYIIMAREAARIMTFEDFQSFMRYNNWKKDPYSNGDPGQMILARYDLRPGYLPHFPKKLFGGLDTKALKLTEAVASMRIHGYGSPEHVFNPPLDFGNWEYKHDGLIDVWNHTWQQFESNRGDRCLEYVDREKCIKTSGCGWCIYDSHCYSGFKNEPIINKCQGGWTIDNPLQPWAIPAIIAVSVIVVLFVIIIYVLHFTKKDNY